MATITDKNETPENEQNSQKEADKETASMGVSSRLFNQRFNYSMEDLYDTFVSGDKPTLRGLFRKRMDRKEKIRLSRQLVWEIGILYKIIQMKVDFIVDGFRLYHEDDDIQELFEEINDKIGLEEYIRNAAFEHEVIGEWYPFLNWNSNDELSNLTILNPEQVIVKSIFGEDMVYLKPTKEIQNLLNHADDEIKKRVRRIVPQRFYEKWSKGKKVLLDDDEVLRYVNQKAYHEEYAHTPIEPIFDDLALLTMYKESDYSISYKTKKAILHVTVGDENFNDGEAVDSELLDEAEDLFSGPGESHEVFTQWFMEPSWIIPDTDVYYPEKYEPVMRSILEWSGLGVFLSDEGSYSDAEIKATGFYQDIKSTRKKIRKSIIDIYKTIAEKQGIKTYGDNLQYPEVKFSNTTLQSNDEKLETVRFLYKHGLLSPDTVLDDFGYSFEEESDIRNEEGKKEKYLKDIAVPFEPSQDISMRSFLRSGIKLPDVDFEVSMPEEDEDNNGNDNEEENNDEENNEEEDEE